MNYRFNDDKYEGARDLAVYVDWKVNNNKLSYELVFNNPLQQNSNAIANQLLCTMKTLGLTDTNSIYNHNTIGYDNIVYEKKTLM